MATNFQQIRSIFLAALERPVDAWDAYLAEACGADADLREQVDLLLQAHVKAGGMLDGATRSNVQPIEQSPREKPGTVIGRYKLLQQIGEGGFGVVYMAEQEKPVKRRVALKVIRAGMDTKAVIARFEAERQALAMMDHPNIARVLDAGATDTGRPYFVMELVKGIPITDYCDQANLDMRERLELFMDVCRAVQHAHQKGVIHRDLKPSNVMVTLHDSKPVVKVIDFGIAKATDQKLTENTLFTNYGQMIGTPVYMSPEQAVMSGLDVDTRSDIYSLGVMLYELLTGSPPFDAQTLRKAGFDEMRRIIREQQPQRPSTKLSTMAADVKLTVATQRQVSPQALTRQLHGDLDWIVLKAIEKDRSRRYDTANGLAADLKRHLDNEPVVARPPSTAYRLQKAWQRNKLACVAGAAIAASLVIGIAASVWQAVRATSAEKRAVAALDELRSTAPAFAEQARALVERERFDDALDKLEYAARLRPDVAEYLIAKGDLLQCQLRLADAAAAYQAALALHPVDRRAEASLAACTELLADPSTKNGKLTREGLSKLHVFMQQQQRPAAELMPVARLLGVEKTLILDYWLARLKDLPISAEKPLKTRLALRDDGFLSLDLSGSKVSNLARLAGAPLAVLDLTDVTGVTDLTALSGMSLVDLNLSGTKVANLDPLRAMRRLEKLSLNTTPVSDLSPLRGLPLKELHLTDCPVSDISPLRGAPLEELFLRRTRVADISALRGMPLKFIDLTAAPVLDFTPLAGLPLEKCILQQNRLGDLTVLRGMPLRELVLWGCRDARNYAVLGEIKTLELLLLPSEYRSLPEEEVAAIDALRHHPKLRQLGSEIMENMGYAATSSKELFWKDWENEQKFVPVLRKGGFFFNLLKTSAGTYSIYIEGGLKDVSILKGAPVSVLTLRACQVVDLKPLRELPLEFLNLMDNPVEDLTPLRGMKIKKLYLSGTKVSDLTPLKGMPLTELYCEACSQLTDVAVLSEIPTLEKVIVPMQARHIEVLRGLGNIRRLAYESNHEFPMIPAITAETFWKEFDANDWLPRLRESGYMIKELAQLSDGTWNVNLADSSIVDLSILSGAPIGQLSIGGAAVSDLRPLKGLPLKSLWIYGTKVTDLSPLEGMALESLNVAGTRVTDLAALRKMPLTTVSCANCDELTDISPLTECKKLTVVTLPPKARNFEFLRDFPNLQRISYTEDPLHYYRPDKTAAEFWKEYDGQGWLRALRESGVAIKSVKQLPDGTWHVDLNDSAISDLKILSGAPISSLWLGGTGVSDLAPLRGMGLKQLHLWGTTVSDLSPIKGLPLSTLHLAATKVADLSALRGMPLTGLFLHDCPDLTDLSPLAVCKELKDITLPPRAMNYEFLRTLPKLERIDFADDPKDGYRPDKTAAQFWKEYDEKKK